MNPQKLLEQFLGTRTDNAGAPAASGSAGGQSGQSVGNLLGGVLGSLGNRQGSGSNAPAGSGGFNLPGGALGGLAAGGILGALLGQKKVRKMAGGALGYGGAAVLGALAHRAYQNWQEGKQTAQAPQATAADVPQEGSRFAPQTAADGKPFALAIIRAMIAAAHADGHIGPDEQKQIFEAANRSDLDADDKAFIFDAMQHPLPPARIAALANDREQATELYLAARIAIDPDHPEEQAFLQALATSLQLPPDLARHLEAQVVQSLGA